ncbi:MAG: hypothetical protein OES20_12815 [Gammaproteobacteria bacterium]|nr:hypothetical protein [Gammaproteobacteria bacterium]MDH3858365.1 hypothetical protein [Gammaproteobacteria bacterium]
MRKLRASEIHADDKIRVIAIEAVHCNAEKSGRFYWLFARIEATAMVVCAAGVNRVINLDSAETSLEELKREVPGLRALLGEV